MTQNNQDNGRSVEFTYQNGRIYFTKKMERKVCFFLTVFMLILGMVSYFTNI
ncbi:hypothetical protein [Desulforapulum autotrophicum]|uniref:hypothetical protein n=1 Tax=Desulforapulum autotrophicum TaxID=2296 RepID=UPI000306706A|nr:hypothetical protein [Desulforapulum autotrophicum]